MQLPTWRSGSDHGSPLSVEGLGKCPNNGFANGVRCDCSNVGTWRNHGRLLRSMLRAVLAFNALRTGPEGVCAAARQRDAY